MHKSEEFQGLGQFKMINFALTDPGEGGISFVFMQFSANILPNNRLAPPLGLALPFG